jgi:hypothetical protein
VTSTDKTATQLLFPLPNTHQEPRQKLLPLITSRPGNLYHSKKPFSPKLTKQTPHYSHNLRLPNPPHKQFTLCPHTTLCLLLLTLKLTAPYSHQPPPWSPLLVTPPNLAIPHHVRMQESLPLSPLTLADIPTSRSLPLISLTMRSKTSLPDYLPWSQLVPLCMQRPLVSPFLLTTTPL